MKFDELDSKMRKFETIHDYYISPEIYMVARIDGRSFTRLTKEIHKFESPYDVKFRDYMVETVKHLMNCGFKVIYGYTESDEISLLFSKDENSFGRKFRKLNSILAGEASSKFSVLLGDVACFDCRISELPTKELVIDYFRWRNEDAQRNSLNSHCYWLMRRKGESFKSATNYLNGKSISFKNQLLFENGINFNDLPNWQKRGVGLYWEEYEKSSYDFKNKMDTLCIRKRIKVDYELPMKDEYNRFLEQILI